MQLQIWQAFIVKPTQLKCSTRVMLVNCPMNNNCWYVQLYTAKHLATCCCLLLLLLLIMT
jgi:hypothetical protein